WTLAENSDTIRRYTATLNYGLYFHKATLDVELLEDLVTLVGPPRMVRYITPLLIRADAAQKLM
ncbi:MAG: hypothetical protein JW910_06350, partial [Anaerolineae bacterium]|nr:hypothetical protein [Anaerolineae bacterium]